MSWLPVKLPGAWDKRQRISDALEDATDEDVQWALLLLKHKKHILKLLNSLRDMELEISTFAPEIYEEWK